MVTIWERDIKGTVMIIDLKFSGNEVALFENLGINRHQIIMTNLRWWWDRVIFCFHSIFFLPLIYPEKGVYNDNCITYYQYAIQRFQKFHGLSNYSTFDGTWTMKIKKLFDR